MSFIDYEKAFDTVKVWAVLNSLSGCRINSRFTKLIESIYSQAAMYIRLQNRTASIYKKANTLGRPDYSYWHLSIFKKQEWSKRGINVATEPRHGDLH